MGYTEKMKKILVIAVLFFIATVAIAATSLFSDGFESGDFVNWISADAGWNVISNTANAHSGGERAEAKGIITDNVLMKQVADVSSSATLSYWYKIASGLEPADHVLVE